MTITKEFTPNTSTIAVMHRSGDFSVSLETDGAAVTYKVIWAASVDWDTTKNAPVTKPGPVWENQPFEHWHPSILECCVETIDLWFAEFPNRLINADLVRALLKLRKDMNNIWMEHQ